jgi:heme A synthase
MNAEVLGNMALTVAAILGVFFVLTAIWAVVDRPSWSKLKSTIYWEISCLGILLGWCVVIYIVRPHDLLALASFLAAAYFCYLAAIKFDQL